MKNFKFNIFALLAAAGSMLTACSDDVLNRENGDNLENGIVIYVPQVDAPTRADDGTYPYDPLEATYTSLHLFAYTDGKDSPAHVNLLEDAEKVGNGYKIELDNGDYEMYVVANVTVTGNETKKQLLEETKIVAPADASKGLPMACSHSDLTTTPSQAGNKITVTSDGSLRIYANMKFAVAKVRVTMLNDLRHSDRVDKMEVTNHSADGTAFAYSSYAAAKGTAFNPSYDYFKCPSVNTTDIKQTTVNNLDKIVDINSHNDKWASQTVFYVAESIDKEENDLPILTMTMKQGGEPAKVKIGEKIGNKMSVKRSKFYDYIGTADGKFELTVKPWEPEIIAGALSGPSILEVDQTSISVVAGEYVDIKYSSNKNIVLNCEDYLNQKIYRLDTDARPGYIRVSLNTDEIDASEFELMKAENKWKSFTVTAGSIVKTIQVEDITYNEYLTSTNNMLTIDVNEKKTSGYYSNTDTIEIQTNLQDIRVYDINDTMDVTKWETQELAKWRSGQNRWPDITSASTTTNSKPSLQLVSVTNGEPIEFDEPLEIKKGVLKIGANYNDLNSDRELWQKNTDLRVLVTGKDHDGNLQKQVIYIYVRSTSDMYRIHLKAPGWNAPHIYAYQALQLPSDHPSYPNVPVGYYHDGAVAALEYDFTGGVAFKGWYTGAKNDPNTMTGKYENQFYIFTNYGEWDLQNGTPNADHYNLIDFCATHREKLSKNKNNGTRCDECTRESFRRGFPGICMLPEGDDWWYFDLTGVATPGKTLIMFTDAQQNGGENDSPSHDLNDEGRGYRRYPAHLSPGVALFDYPNREGWFVWTDQNTHTVFYSSKEEALGGSGGGGGNTYDPYEGEPALNGKQRIYFQQGSWNQAYVYMWKNSNNTVVQMNKLTTTAGSGWFYLDIDKGSYQHVIFKPQGGTGAGDWNGQVPGKDANCPNIGSDDRVYYGSNGFKTADFHIY